MRWRALKRLCSEPAQYGLNVSAKMYTIDGIRLIRTSDIGRDARLNGDANAIFVDPAVVEQRHRLKVGDLLLSRSGTLGRCLLVDDQTLSATFAGFLVRFRPSPEMWPPYLAFCMQARFFQDAIAAEAVSSTISNFNAERYSSVAMPCPSTTDQKAIAFYLASKVARIDHTIRARERQLELLRERWNSETSKRLLEATRMYGSIPLKWIATCLDGRRIPLSTEERSKRPGPYPYFGASTVVDHVDEFIFDEVIVLLGEDGAQLVDPTAVISLVVRERCWVNNHAHVLRAHSYDPGLLSQHLNTFDRMPFVSGATRPKITQDDMGSIPVPRLPEALRQGLRSEIDESLVRLSRLSARVRQQVDRLSEHRLALITSAVTGRLDLAREISDEAS